MDEQRIDPPDCAECPEPRAWSEILVSELPSIKAPAAKSLAAVDIVYAHQLKAELDEGILVLTDLKHIGKVTAEKVPGELEDLARGILETEELRRRYAR